MKFCTKCGAELLDEAVICTKCGCMVDGARVPAVKAPKSRADGLLDVAEKKPSMLLTVFNFAFAVLVVFALFFAIMAIGDGRVKSSLYDANPSIYSVDYQVSSYFYPIDDFMIPALLFSLLSFGTGVFCFVMTLVEKHRGERLFCGIFRFFVGVMLLILTAYFTD